VPGIIRQGRCYHLMAATVDADRFPPFRTVFLQIIESEETAGLAHGLINRLAEFTAVNHPGYLGCQQPAPASQVFLDEPVACLERFAVFSVNAPGVFGKSREFTLDMLGRVSADDESLVRELDRRGKQAWPGKLAVLFR